MPPHASLFQQPIQRRTIGLAALATPLLGVVQAAPASAAPPTGVSPFGAGTTHAWGGREPRSDSDNWLFDLPGSSRPENPRRSELWWTVYGDPATYVEGDVANYEADIIGDLGPAHNTAEDWHVIWQLHGATHGVWKGPAQTLTVANGKLRMTGGSGHPDHDPAAGRYYQWFKDLVPFQNNRSYAFRVQTYLSTKPELGWITVWMDGQKILDRWVPQSHTGLRPGTIMPGQPVLNNRSGLYRGTLPGRSAPSYRQWIRHSRPLVF